MSLDQRYTSAWGEISARIGARQTAYVQFATVSVGAATGALSLIMREANDKGWIAIVANAVSIALVVYSWIFVLWIRNNDKMIGLLGAYLAELERMSQSPRWHTETEGWIVLARDYGQNSVWAGMALTAITSLPAFFIGVARLGNHQVWLGIVLLLFASAGNCSAVFLHETSSIRLEIAQYTAAKVREEADRLRTRRASRHP